MANWDNRHHGAREMPFVYSWLIVGLICRVVFKNREVNVAGWAAEAPHPIQVVVSKITLIPRSLFPQLKLSLSGLVERFGL